MIRVQAALGGLVTGLLAVAATANAKPINYQEQFDGDLPASGPLPVFTLDNGQNLIAGTTGPSDFDSFAFVVPAGKTLLGGGVVVTDRPSGGTADIAVIGFILYADSTTAFEGTFVRQFNVNSPGAVTLSALGPGTYNFSQFNLERTPGGTGDDRSDYAFTLDVVPEPAGMAALAVAGVALRRRRTPT